MTQFGKYSQYYDIFYKDKDYSGEVQYIVEVLRRHGSNIHKILDLGCGTAQHASLLVKEGFGVHGVDVSESMLRGANERRAELTEGERARLSLSQGDVRNVRLNERFDAVLSLFHVMSYMPDEDSLLAAFNTASTHLKPGGLFVFDCWHGPAVLTERPEIRTREFRDGNVMVSRTATPELLHNEDLVKVHYLLAIDDPPGTRVDEVRETHTMRYWFLPELRHLLGRAGFVVEAAYEYRTFSPPTLNAWNLLIVAKLPTGSNR